IGAVYVNGTMVYEGAVEPPRNTVLVLRIPTGINATRGDLLEVEVAGTSGVTYRATGYAG
ncbi:MAG: hypothetical protein QI199_05880, partial [Candidatus Korarchaeota archaeon]|nr:hypothetical protein [Candidatus Korarchaeota archaeon]